MKIIFCDVDGVLNCQQDFVGRKTRHVLCPDKIARFHDIIARTGADVVLSSTWRKYPPSMDCLNCNKVKFIDVTPIMHGPNFGTYIERGMEIEAWLKEHPDVERYCILDDDSDMLPNQMSFFVQTNFNEGLQQEHVERVVEILNKGE